jgi:hypothetical protein
VPGNTGEDEQQGKGASMKHGKRYCKWSG